MRKKQATYLIIILTLIVLSTFGLQFYWNYQNFENSTKATNEEIKTLFEQSITHYFEEESKKNVISYLSNEEDHSSLEFMDAIKIDTVLKKLDANQNNKNHKKTSLRNVSVSFKEIESDFEFQKTQKEVSIPKKIKTKKNENKKIIVLHGQKALDSIGDFTRFKNRIVISMSKDIINYKNLDSLINRNLTNKKLYLQTQLWHAKNDSVHYPEADMIKKLPFHYTYQSSFINKNENLEVYYDLPQSIIFRKIGIEILLSLLLSLIILFFMIYLLQIIKKQQKMDSYKNEFISNMTHEFKTPITTIKTALEGLTYFNMENNPKKTIQYLEISNHQLDKLNLLVEKILETSTLKTTQIQIQNDAINMDEMLEKIVSKYQTITTKKILIETTNTNILLNSDAFHVEQIISNLIDNAVKYGGKQIILSIEVQENKLYINCKDSGKGIEKSEQKKIFEQFYRISNGNQHDVKGFGIGLFYAKTLAQKLDGNLTYQEEPQSTFTLTLPYEFSH